MLSRSRFSGTERWMVMGMANKCENCAEKCPQAERAHQTALGRMYATNEFTALLKKVESGELVEVVRCKDCVRCTEIGLPRCRMTGRNVTDDDFCSRGERRTNE